MTRSNATLGAVLLAAALLTSVLGCFFLPFDPDPDLQHGSPCVDVNLIDGVDEESTGELDHLFQCLNQTGAFDALQPAVDEVVEGSDREIQPLGLHVAVILNEAPGVLPVWELLSATRQLLAEQNVFLTDALHLIAEWVYGVPWSQVGQLSEAGQLQDTNLLAEGPLARLVPILRVWCEAILDEDDIGASGEVLDHLLSMPELLDTLVTLRELLAHNDEHHLFDDFSAHWGEFFLSTHDDTTGENTLVEVVDALVSPVPELPGQPPAIETMLPEADLILSDLVVRERLVKGIGDLHDDGTLAELPDQLKWLMTVDMHGSPLGPGESSAFESSLVLLDGADAPFNCLDLIYTDSVSVWLLQEIVILGLEADSIEELVLAVESLYDWLIEVVDLLCEVPPILKTHFDAIIRLAESGALHSMIPLLYAIADPDSPAHNYLQELIDIVQILVNLDLIEPVEALLAPTLGQPFMPAVLAGIGAFADPSYPLAAGDVYTLLDVVTYLISPPEGEGYDRSPIVIGGRVIDGIVDGEPDEVDAFLVAWGELLANPNAVTSDLLYGIDGLLELDPELNSLDYVGDILANEELATHWLLLFEDPELMAALGAPGSAAGDEVPLAALGRLIADDDAADLLLLLGWLVDLLETLGI